jgi:hypothetical protein
MIDAKKVLDKVKKLLAVGECKTANPNEAEQAILMAHKLLAENKLRISDIKDENEVMAGNLKVVGCKPFANRLMKVLSDNFQCEYLTTYIGRKVSGFKLFGYSDAILLCQEVFIFTYKFIQREGIRLKEMTKYSRQHYRNVEIDYANGFIDGLKAKLDEQSRALLIVTPKETTDAYNEFCESKKIKTVQNYYSINRSSKYYDHGFRDGNKIDFKAKALEARE